MEHGTSIYNNEICNSNFMKYVGWEDDECTKKYFNKKTIELISRKVTELTLGVDPKNRRIKVPEKTICSVMSAIYTSFRPPTGDIYSRYIIPSGMSPENYIQKMVNQVIQRIVAEITTTLGMEEHNRSLTIWTTLLGDFNEKGLRSHAPIKVLNKRPNPMQFNMNY